MEGGAGPHLCRRSGKPDEAHSLYTRLNETHSGKTPGAAIPFQRNMECFEGLYYTDAESLPRRDVPLHPWIPESPAQHAA